MSACRMCGADPDAPGRRMRYKEAAAFLGISVEKLRKDVYDGTAPPHYRLGDRTVVFDDKDLSAYMAGCRVEPGRRSAK